MGKPKYTVGQQVTAHGGSYPYTLVKKVRVGEWQVRTHQGKTVLMFEAEMEPYVPVTDPYER